MLVVGRAAIDERDWLAERVVRRRVAERILAYASVMRDRDRVLLEQVYRMGVPMSEIAYLREQSPSTVQRRVAALLRRMRDPVFRVVFAALEFLPRRLQATARCCVLEGRSQREAARRCRLTLHQVRLNLQAIRTFAEMPSAALMELNND